MWNTIAIIVDYLKPSAVLVDIVKVRNRGNEIIIMDWEESLMFMEIRRSGRAGRWQSFLIVPQYTRT